MDISSKIAQGLLSIGAVFLRPQEPFIWASGIKSPIYCDNRLILTAPAVRDTVERAIADTVRREFPQAEVLMGTATAGIAHAAGSVLDTVAALREAGAEVLGVVSIFTYGMKKGVERMAEAKVKSVSLTNLDTIARVGAEEHYITEADVARLLAFRDDPADESWITKGGTN